MYENPLVNRALKLGLIEGDKAPSPSGFFEVFEAIRKLGFVVILKWDGERSEHEGAGTHTVIISGLWFEGELFREDDNSLEVAISKVLTRFLDYFEKRTG